MSYATLAERPVTLGTRAMLQACAARHAQAALALLHRISSARGKTGRTTLERTLARDRLPLHLACLEDCGAVFAVELTARVACHVRAAALPPLVTVNAEPPAAGDHCAATARALARKACCISALLTLIDVELPVTGLQLWQINWMHVAPGEVQRLHRRRQVGDDANSEPGVEGMRPTEVIPAAAVCNAHVGQADVF